MISSLDPNFSFEPGHTHTLTRKARLQRRISYGNQVSKPSRFGRHTLTGIPHSKAIYRRSRQSFYWSPTRLVDEDFWHSHQKQYLSQIRTESRIHGTKFFSQERFFINWPQIITRDTSSSAPPKILRTPDHEARLEFAKSIGLSKLPPVSDDSFTQLYGLFDTIMKSESEHDSVQTVRRLRRE